MPVNKRLKYVDNTIYEVTWPADTKVPVVRGQWQRNDAGEIEATYTKDVLALCMACVLPEERWGEML